MTSKNKKIIAIWLIVGVAMVLVQIMLGGITRLTGSGLSITEWGAILGAVPPMNHEQWITAFEKYKQFDQYKLVNTAMTLQQFKGIFFWEFMHRNWARLMSIVFLVPLIYFLWKKLLAINELPKILVIVFLGALEGLMGWIMVASGLEQNKVLVNPVKLMGHLMIASIILAYTLRLSLEYLYPKQHHPYDKTARNFTRILLLLVFTQIAFGALMAGSKAALNCTTFPLMNGSYIPPNLGFHQPWQDFIYENNMTFQFLHRNMAYLIFLFVVFFFFKTKNTAAQFEFHRTRWFLLIMVVIQALLGIFTLINSEGKVPVVLGVAHQLGAFLLLIFSVEAHYFVKYKSLPAQKKV
ncbi:MAG: heme synthase [Bacteroidota bacterium]|nr:heme synthase [Bacteroidota bacterium]